MKVEKSNNLAVEKALKLLLEQGYSVKKNVEYTKKTFEVSVETLDKVRLFQSTLGYKLKDVVEEAFSSWLDQKEAEYERKVRAKGK